MDIKINDTGSLLGLMNKEKYNDFRVKVECNKEIIKEEHIERSNMPKIRKIDKEVLNKERIKSINSFFIDFLGRPLTEKELIEYLDLFNSRRATAWDYLKTLKERNIEIISI
jgi:hypothetical protein